MEVKKLRGRGVVAHLQASFDKDAAACPRSCSGGGVRGVGECSGEEDPAGGVGPASQGKRGRMRSVGAG